MEPPDTLRLVFLIESVQGLKVRYTRRNGRAVGFDLDAALAILSSERPIFHSEADFQHALAWQVHAQLPQANIRLEYRPLPKEPIYIDLWIELPDGLIAIELKYPTRRLDVTVNGEHYSLANQAAQNNRRYDFVKDIVRLEYVIDALPRVTGYAVLLTNDSGHWSASRRNETADAAFRIHDGATLSGTLAWAQSVRRANTSRMEAHSLRGVYPIGWRDYSSLQGINEYARFRYTSVCVR